jgi:hypothetical protein
MRWLALSATMASLPLSMAVPATSQDAKRSFPNRPIHIVTPIAPGGNMDLSVRIFADKLVAILGQPVIVDNRPGAGSLIGIQVVLGAPADGYTLLGDIQLVPPCTPADEEPSLRSQKDFAGIGFINSVPLVLTVGSLKPDRTVEDLIARARANPGMVSYASGGIASQHPCAGRLVCSRRGPRPDPRALQGQRTGDGRSHRRPHRFCIQYDHQQHCVYRSGPAASSRRARKLVPSYCRIFRRSPRRACRITTNPSTPA